METTVGNIDPLSASPARWFVRGFTVGVLIFGAINAMSYFVRSDGFGNLLGTYPDNAEAIGFPVEIWERGNAYNGYYVDYLAVFGNMLTGAIFAALLGGISARSTTAMNRMAQQFEDELDPDKSDPFQFSIRGLLGATALAAIIAGLWRSSLTARPELLGGVYFLGPLVLIAVAMLPRNVHWQQRIAIVIPSTLALIAAAIAIGGTLEKRLEFDQVLLGIFVCWTPQSVVAAIALTLIILWQESNRLGCCPRGE